MRFGLNTFLVSSGFTDAELPLLQTFKNYGADVIELAIVEPAAVSVPKLITALEASGLEQPIICGAFPPGRDLRGNTEERAASAQYISELITLAKAVDSKIVCGPFYSVTGQANAYSSEERAAQLDMIAAELRPLCQQAEAAGVTLAVEPLNRFETDCINTIDQAIELIEKVGSPCLKIHIDTFHMNIEEADSAAAILRAGQHIGHVHASASHRGLLGKDQVDWSGICAALVKINYQGDILIESFTVDNTVIAKAASIWRPLYDGPEQLAVEGLQFLRETWELAQQ
ncbi:MAG: sugar phosphate isomerase/epimerase [Opitutales bacterium]|jgi:D-psicose/D-tagatose/L-ribulose 3-epimerase|nr:sugar phosphate isomerase/epimerase [Opitutales bacterium]MDP4644248.1 sugar phosphate isomerase/epimerase [Opitutales bacterium]MDP4777751.1 sugar phosphate isomerase/epimerase [Opitutales bacterium]MDP4882557.1 sugar phosphate isomerase/epimerase [Opitutales bacterium]